jgi:hypothetical protein
VQSRSRVFPMMVPFALAASMKAKKRPINISLDFCGDDQHRRLINYQDVVGSWLNRLFESGTLPLPSRAGTPRGDVRIRSVNTFPGRWRRRG